MMANSKILFLLTFLLGFCNIVFGQKADSVNFRYKPTAPPILVESFMGTEGALVATTFSKPLVANSKFGIFSIAEYYGVYKTENQKLKNQFMAQTHLTYRLFKNFSISAGGILTQASGFRPTAGVQYRLKTKDLSLLLAPRFDLSQTYNGEFMGFVEYTPKLSEDWSLYSRVQGLYNHDFKDDLHSVSYIRARLGTSYKVFRFGVGGNFSFFGPQKINNNEYGIFIGALFF